MDEKTVRVRPFMRVVANGIASPSRPDGEAMLRLTLVITPELVAPDSASGFEMAKWPAEIARLIRDGALGSAEKGHVTLWVEQFTGTDAGCGKTAKTVKASAPGVMAGKESDWNAVAALWKRYIESDLAWPEPWLSLSADIDRSLKGEKHHADLQGKYAPADPGLPEPGKNGYDPKNNVILGVQPKADVKQMIRDVLPIGQSDLVVDEERTRGARVMRKLHKGPYSLCEPPEVIERLAGFASFKQAVEKTCKERSDTKKHNGDIKTALQTRPGGAATADHTPAAKTSRRAPSVLPTNAGAFVAGQPSDHERTTHEYGTWGQFRSGALPAKNCPQDVDKLDLVRGRFYAAQGDPILSRLFCLAVDLLVPISRLGTALDVQIVEGERAGEKIDLIFHWAADDDTEDATRPSRVVTAARFLSQRVTGPATGGAPTRLRWFWPVSIFEAGVGRDDKGGVFRVSRPELVEQRNGIWRTGKPPVSNDADAAPPRYTLTSLDVRRAVDAKPDGVDRGDRHHTAGLTLLDRERAPQAARDMAIAELQAQQGCAPDKKRATVFLHAEELTIGRRVDLAAIAAGADISTAKWRSLMSRFVSFHGLDPAAERIFAAVIGGDARAGVFDEYSFQVAARLIPRFESTTETGKTDDKVDYDAITEEAIFTWDGSPSVLTDTSRPQDRCGIARAPFTRRYRPPTTRDSQNVTHAPLRFGVPYLLRFRSAFLGGGSPSPHDPGCAHDGCADDVTIPPSAGGRAMPRRFLRHENIGAPLLLLPRRLADLSHKEMGYEQLDQAIVRSSVTSDCLPEPVFAAFREDHRPPKVKLADRVKPHETMRVFYPPAVSVETARRHGALDGADPAAVLRGGLQGVLWEPFLRGDPTEDPKRVPGGFPTAVTDRAPALTPEGAVYRRRVLYGRSCDDDRQNGIPVFELGASSRPPKGGHGFLPDPAIDLYSVRARIPGSDRYLTGDVSARLYDQPHKIGYPHALPLVVEIVRVEGRRPKPLETIKELFETAEAPLCWLNRSNVVSSAPNGGVPVRHLRARLYQAEEFDLEVACLPSVDMLSHCFALPETISIQLRQAGLSPQAGSFLKELCGFDACRALPAFDDAQMLTGLRGLSAPTQETIAAVAGELIERQRRCWPIEEIAAVTRLRICHAVNAPLEQPFFGRPEGATEPVPAWPRQAGADGKPGKPVVAFRPPLDAILELAPADCGPFEAPNAKTLLLSGWIWLDLDGVDGFEIRAAAVAPTTGVMDDRSRGRSLMARRSGRWPSMLVSTGGSTRRMYVSKRSVLGFDVDEDGVVDLVPEHVTLLRVDGLPARGAVPADSDLYGPTHGRYTAVNLGLLHAYAIRGAPCVSQCAGVPGTEDHSCRSLVVRASQPTIISDTKARQLCLTLVAIGRHVGLFETAPAYLNGREELLLRRQPLATHEQTRTSDPLAVEIQATDRPAALEVRRPEPSFAITRYAYRGPAGAMNFVVRRRAPTRLFFARGWFSSGEEERVGIVLWPPNYLALTEQAVDEDRLPIRTPPIDLTNFEDKDLGPAGTFVTRWGGDPIRRDETPQKGVLIPPDSFLDLKPGAKSAHAPKFVPNVLMPVPFASDDDATADETKPPQREMRAVSLLTYKPCFDINREEWYVDVDLDPRRAADPFIRFGLVRYQEKAIPSRTPDDAFNDAHCSTPVTVWSQLLPERTLTVTLSAPAANGARRVRLTAEGHGQLGVKDIEIDKAFPKLSAEKREAMRNSFATLQRPALRAFIFHETTDATGLTRRTNLLDEPEGYLRIYAKQRNETLEWTRDVELSDACLNAYGPGSCVVYVEEVDRRMPASYASEPILPASMFDAKTFQESGPRFNARIAILEMHGQLVEALN
ncbi:hypothetical protein AMST5_00119 [freshwater sediment metagenome]|uniref:Uncharacterized protein n=1 Tax=freshwater sediment metagenome TaxID=556182 RepID=A0AA48LWT1_9ZZZZ